MGHKPRTGDGHVPQRALATGLVSTTFPIHFSGSIIIVETKGFS